MARAASLLSGLEVIWEVDVLAIMRGTAEPRPGGGVTLKLLFDPDREWGEKDVHHVAGTVDGRPARGALKRDRDGYCLDVGAAWCRDSGFAPAVGDQVNLELVPEGPQLSDLQPDLREAIEADPQARRFFESLATFYRNGYVRWVESAKRPATRATRITDTVAALRAHHKQGNR